MTFSWKHNVRKCSCVLYVWVNTVMCVVNYLYIAVHKLYCWLLINWTSNKCQPLVTTKAVVVRYHFCCNYTLPARWPDRPQPTHAVTVQTAVITWGHGLHYIIRISMGQNISATVSCCLSKQPIIPNCEVHDHLHLLHTKLRMYEAMRDFRLLLQSRQELRSSGLLCSE
jgi:hypothetical protein